MREHLAIRRARRARRRRSAASCGTSRDTGPGLRDTCPRARAVLPQASRRIEHREMRGAGIEPDVQNVGFLAPVARRRSRAARARRASSSSGVVREPGVGAFLAKPTSRTCAQRRVVVEQLAACIAIENRSAARPRIAGAKRTSPAARRSSSECARAPHSGVHCTLGISLERGLPQRRRFRRADRCRRRHRAV